MKNVRRCLSHGLALFLENFFKNAGRHESACFSANGHSEADCLTAFLAPGSPMYNHHTDRNLDTVAYGASVLTVSVSGAMDVLQARTCWSPSCTRVQRNIAFFGNVPTASVTYLVVITAITALLTFKSG